MPVHAALRIQEPKIVFLFFSQIDPNTVFDNGSVTTLSGFTSDAL